MTSSPAADGPQALPAAQTWLLRAALLSGGEAAEAWKTWTTLTTVDALDEASTWLLPLLYHNLSSQALAPEDELVRYGNVYRHNWYKNNLVLHRARPRIDALAAEGARPLVRGGAAMALGYYGALAARPIDRMTATAADPADRSLVAVEWKRVPLWVPGPDAQMLDICAARSAWDSRSSLFWIADAAILAARHPSVADAAPPPVHAALEELRTLGLLP